MIQQKECGHSAKRDASSDYCHSCYMNEYRRKNPEKNRAYQRLNRIQRIAKDPEKVRSDAKYAAIKNKYGLSKEQYQKLMQDHNNQCDLCGCKRRPVVDHCHETGRIRGVLCTPCNTAIGRVAETDEAVLKLLKYLRDGIK